MMDRTFVLDNEARVEAAARFIAANWRQMLAAGHAMALRCYEYKDDKSREQEERYHAMLNDIARQCQHLNMALDKDTWKRLCIDQFKRETLKEPECCARYWARHQLNMIPSLDGSAMVVLGEQSRRFPKGVAAVFIEWLFAWGAQHDVEWSDPSIVPIEVYSREVAA